MVAGAGYGAADEDRSQESAGERKGDAHPHRRAERGFEDDRIVVAETTQPGDERQDRRSSATSAHGPSLCGGQVPPVMAVRR